MGRGKSPKPPLMERGLEPHHGGRNWGAHYNRWGPYNGRSVYNARSKTLDTIFRHLFQSFGIRVSFTTFFCLQMFKNFKYIR